ncbi:Major facilitator superfamily MFS_1 [Pseudodesulfovibrio piezophilus C1TLV30]|uniref:Major facilitator superfamily MFS_1 n=2 Tax=Pseudodesulfovibrio TaxID=2035811 RepID=M1WM88_PSEP2|nr:Major facilitator superfamily MFS_1 [Pseudodesulfovibrio piezophilus C1TLV30]
MPPVMTPRTDRCALWSWAFYDWANSSFAALVQTFVFAAYFARAVAENETVGTAQWGSMMGITGVCIALGGPLLGAVADRSGRRKPWLGLFTGMCILATAALWSIEPSPEFVWPALVLAGVGTLGSEYAMIFYNAMLPDLAEPKAIGRWSGWGWGLGYAGGLVLLLIALYGFVEVGAWFAVSREKAMHVRAVMPLTACWYLIFCLPLFLWTPDAPPSSAGSALPLGQSVKQGIAQVRLSLKEVRKYRDIGIFLLARLFYNDGLTTMFAFGGIYAAGTFGMTPSQIILFGVGLNVTAGLGAAGFAWMDDRLGPRRTIQISLLCLTGCAAVILSVRSVSLFWGFGLVMGFFVGPVQASSRSYLAHVAPAEIRGEMFGLFALSGKVTSFLGPLLVGWLTVASGSQRGGMSAILVLLGVGLVGMFLVPPVRENKE